MLDPGVRMRREVRLMIGSPQELVGHGARRREFLQASARTTAHHQQHEPVCAATQQRAARSELRPTAQVPELANLGHYPQIEQPAAIADEIAALVSRARRAEAGGGLAER